jgi:glycerol-3-phosphate dehydrogenase
MQAHSAPASNRLAPLAGRAFDLLVVGGGATGCGIAHDAALRGLSVALIEKGDFASGTSSKSSRLIHGGVRYLENGQLHLVFESSAERRRLLRLAPHLVHPLQFTWPVYEGARIPRWKLSAGLTLYDALALFRNVGRHNRLSRAAVLEREPMLSEDGLRGGATYFDAATNDSRLTLANAIAAAEAGATVVNHARSTGWLVEGGRVVGATVVDSLGSATVDVRAKVIVNATGPWSGEVRGSKGAHIAVPRERVGNRNALTLLSPRDGRVLFALPAGDNAIIGTTDTYASASPDEVRASNEDVRYLLDAANAFFPRANLRDDDVVSAWAGIRPLVPARGDTPGAVSREHAITTSGDGVISITGGKLTTYRVMAAQVVDAVAKRLGRAERSSTANRVLPGGDFTSLDKLVATIARTTNDVELAGHLARTYGSRWEGAWAEIAAHGTGRVIEGLPYTMGELRYSVQHEMARTLGDLFIRRTHVAFETRDHGATAAPVVAEAIAPLLGWDFAQQRRAIEQYEREVDRVFAVES